jgi:hypothetical protein
MRAVGCTDMMGWTSIGLYAEMQQRLTPITPLVTLNQVLPSAYAVKNIKQRNIVLRVVIHYAKKVHPRRLLVSNCALLDAVCLPWFLSVYGHNCPCEYFDHWRLASLRSVGRECVDHAAVFLCGVSTLFFLTCSCLLSLSV